MKFPLYTLCGVIPPERYDLLLVQWIHLGMLGSEEQTENHGVRVRVYFKDQTTAQKAAQELRETGYATDVAVDQVEQQDWNAQWRASMKPARLARGYWVSPLWLPPPATATHWIKIEPKMAFGTGHHETTRLAAASIIAHQRRLKGKWILDIGTGSGVLCFVADSCGASCCTGIEIDPCCRENMAENHRLNSPTGAIGFLIGSLDAVRGRALFDCAVMNMLITESAPLLDKVAFVLKSAGHLIWSGILTDEHNEAIGRAKSAGFVLKSDKRENEWWCGVFRKDEG
jgi:ribosomal protein L11 methyltransferase